MSDFATSYFPALLKVSGQAAVLVLLVLAAQWLLGKRLSPKGRGSLWLLVVLRLAFPWTIPSSISLFNYLNVPAISAPISTEQLAPMPSEQVFTANVPAPQTDWMLIVLMIWAAGALFLTAYLAFAHWRIWRKVALRRPLIDASVMNLLEDCKQLMGVRAPVTLVETDAVGSPSLFGFVRPRLLLPIGFTHDFSEEELRFVFLHELSHLKRYDIPIGWLATFLQILHWFNPLVWLAFHRQRVDRELACDALALSYAREGENQPYGRTIIKLLEDFGHPAWAPSLAGIAENINQMKERINMIAKFQKTNRGPALALLLFTVLGLITLTDARHLAAAENPQDPPHIIATTPAIGAKGVDPSLTEITVQFDCDMARGFSWTGGGPQFPNSPEGKKAHWKNRRTCVLPVALEPGHYYRAGINSTSFQNFRSANGVPVAPTAIYFTTRGASETANLQTETPQIVTLDPPNGAKNVSAALTELRVTFSVPMGEGFSWCGGGPKFPESPDGKSPSWTADHKTCVLPVTLQPDHEYLLGINSRSFNNFQSASGIPLKPVVYTFKTAGK